jgi:nitrogen fixation protein FixH
MKSIDAPRGLISGRHVLIGMVAFFATVTAVNAVMMYKAISTFGGETDDAYRIGLKYNQRIALEQSQDQLGWSQTVAYEPSESRLSVTLKDRNGRGIDNLDVIATIGRPATSNSDRDLKLVSIGEGRYRASLPDLPEGTWAVDLTASEGDAGNRKVVYRSKVRLWKQP